MTVAAGAGPPNIVVILADDLGYGDLSVQGAPDLESPHIDGLMAAGIRLERFYANCPVCSPSRAAILSGMFPDLAGVPGVIRTPLPGRATSWGDLRDDVELLPARLRRAGYHTAIVGKWHLGLESPDLPNERGFERFEGFLGDMMDDYHSHRRHGRNYMRRDSEVIDPEGHATDLFTGWAVDYIRERAAAADGRPFFLYLAYNAPHTPIQPPAEWLSRVRAREPGIGEARARLVALIEHLDHGVGQVVAALKETGCWARTLTVFTSDNGGQLDVGARNAPLRGGKQEMWEGGIRVPAGAAWPGRIVAGRVDQHTVLLGMDLHPTLAEVAGAPAGPGIDGCSFAPLLLGRPFAPPERDLFWVRLEGGPRYGGIPYHAVRRGDWKLLRNDGFEPYRLFDLGRDPGESSPVPRDEAREIHDALSGALERHINRAGRVSWQRAGEPGG